jgi:hypothetical protein
MTLKRLLPALALFLLFAPVLAAEDEVVGTLTVHGKTTTFHHVYASLETGAGDPEDKYLVLLISDAPLPEGDRSSGHLASLAKQEQIHALKVRWHVGYDGLAVVPYHAEIPESGSTVRGLGMIDLQEFDDKKVAVKLGSHKLGQDWHYSARVRANLRRGGTVEIEPDAKLVAVSPVPQPGEAGDPLLALKKELGGLEYEYNAENFVRAVKDGNVQAVKLFLKAGMSANTKDGDQHAMLMGAMFCAYDPKPVRDEVLLALLAAKGNPNAADDNNATALLWASENCGAEVIRAMIRAGANVNARAKGGGTPLIMADAFKRNEIARILREAGAKP